MDRSDPHHRRHLRHLPLWKHAEAKRLFSLIPWVVAGMLGGGLALALSEPVLRRMIGAIVLLMIHAVLVAQAESADEAARRLGGVYGIAAGPVMNMYLLTQNLPKEQFVPPGRGSSS